VANPEGTGHGRSGLYFGENGEHNLYEVAQAISKALVDTGHAKGVSTEPTTFSKEDLEVYFAVCCYLSL
jgi:hypothetical protein